MVMSMLYYLGDYPPALNILIESLRSSPFAIFIKPNFLVDITGELDYGTSLALPEG
jgi:hypothetical protein